MFCSENGAESYTIKGFFIIVEESSRIFSKDQQHQTKFLSFFTEQKLGNLLVQFDGTLFSVAGSCLFFLLFYFIYH